MRDYFLTDGIKYSIPYSLEALCALKLQPNTLIWYRGLGKWTEAQDIEELHDLFPPMPPPLHREDEDDRIIFVNLFLYCVGLYLTVEYNNVFLLPVVGLSILAFVQTKSSSRLHKIRLLLPFLSVILHLSWAGLLLQICMLSHRVRKAVEHF